MTGGTHIAADGRNERRSSPFRFLRLYWGACAKCGATISDGERYCDYCRPRKNRG